MANLLESSQTQATEAPGYYTNYLGNLASAGQAAASGASYVGAQPLQEQAFANVGAAGSAYKPTLEAATGTLGQAAGAGSPLSAASPYLQTASGNLGAAATDLMNPYTANVVNAIGDVGQRNIMQNLAPQATAGAVGSGQFGSKRGAEVLGQTIQNANRDILNQQYQAQSAGYNAALQAALQKQQLEGQLGSTAGNLASQGQQNLTQAGTAQGNLAATNQALGLADINALSTLGGQQQTIKQNEELFPLTNLSTLSGMLRGYNVPTTTKTTMEMSPLSVLGGGVTGLTGMFTPGTGTDKSTPFDKMMSAYDSIKGRLTGATEPLTGGATAGNSNEGTSGMPDITSGPDITQTGSPDITSGPDIAPEYDPYALDPNQGYYDENGEWVPTAAHGGSIRSHADGGSAGAWNSSFAPSMSIGGLPSGGQPQYDQSNTYVGYNNTDGSFVTPQQ